MTKETHTKLQKFGLSDKEADIYLALLQLGTAAASDIAKSGGVNRSTAYVVLESLAKKGLASISVREGVRHYSASSPERLVNRAEQSAKEYSELAKLGRQMLSELQNVGKSSLGKSTVRVFDGTEGIKAVYEDISTSKDDVTSYTAEDVMNDTLGVSLSEFRSKILQKGLGLKIIANDTPAAREIISENKTPALQYSLISGGNYGSELVLYGNKVAFMSPREKISYVIDSEEFSKAIKILLDSTLMRAHKWEIKAEPQPKDSVRQKERVLAKSEKRFFRI